ncbi:MAG: hypothetical protein WAN11_14935 [Syntrophobacteraceae bacterium]
MVTSFRPERVLFRPGAVGPPARIATACGGSRTRISTLSLTCPRPEAVPVYASAQPIDFLSPFGAALGNPEMAGHQTVRAPFGAALGNPEMAGHQTVRAPFGAALGNPEMAGHQTVRARTKNASFPNGNLVGRGICPGVSGWTLTKSRLRGVSLRTQVGAEQTGVDIFSRHDFGK